MSNDLKRYNIMISINNNDKEIENIDKIIKDNYKKIKDYSDCKDKKKRFIFGVILSSCFFGNLKSLTSKLIFSSFSVWLSRILTVNTLSLFCGIP